jgi:hypothetical protein
MDKRHLFFLQILCAADGAGHALALFEVEQASPDWPWIRNLAMCLAPFSVRFQPNLDQSGQSRCTRPGMITPVIPIRRTKYAF